MDKVRVELHMTKAEIKLLDAISKLERRSRKNLCETIVRNYIESHQLAKKSR
jgi:hypothetical protein